MPVPKKHKTHSRTHSRRSHLALKQGQFAVCSHCGSAMMPHKVCSHCGYYKGKEVVNTLAKTEKKAKKVQMKKTEMGKEEKHGGEPQSLEELSKSS